MKLDRMLWVLTVLLQDSPDHPRGSWTAPELAEKFEVSRRTICRDIEALCQAGIPIVTRQGGGGGISIAEGFRLDKSVLTTDELSDIAAALKGIGSITGKARLERMLVPNCNNNTMMIYIRHGGDSHVKASEGSAAHSGRKGGIKKDNSEQDSRDKACRESNVDDYQEEQELHVIMDNHSIHKGLDQWLKEPPNMHIHYTPTSVSWLNMIEIWFGIFTRKVLNGASFSSVDNLVSKIMLYIESYSEYAHPFIWRKRDVAGSQIRNTLHNLDSVI